MKEWLPIWLQCVAMLCLFAVWAAAAIWAGPTDYGVVEVFGHNVTGADITQFYMPITILFLGARFCWRFARLYGGEKKTRLETCFYTTGLLLTLITLCLFLLWPARQRVRESANTIAQLNH